MSDTTLRTPSAPAVPQGYKQTEVGVIPQDWKIASFTEVTDLITCGLAATPTYVEETRGYPFLSSTNVKSGRVLWRNYKYISPELHKRLYLNNPPKKGNILYSRVGTIGEAAVIENDTEFSVYVSLTLIKPKAGIDSYYLAHLLNSPAYKQRAKNQVYLGGGVGNLNVEVVRDYPIILPSTKLEQQAIAEALSDADALIAGLESLIAKKQQVKQGALQNLMSGEVQLAGFDGDWHEVRLGMVGKCYRGVSYNPNRDLSASDTKNTVRLLRSNNVQGARVVFTDLQFVDVNRITDDQKLRTKDVVICMANGSRDLVGKAAQFFANDGFDYTFGAFMGCFRPALSKANFDFVFYLFQTEKYRSHISVLLAGSSINNLKPNTIEEFAVSVPTDKTEQAAIANILIDMDTEIAGLETKLSKARRVKEGMMQDLLTGKVRLV